MIRGSSKNNKKKSSTQKDGGEKSPATQPAATMPKKAKAITTRTVNKKFEVSRPTSKLSQNQSPESAKTTPDHSQPPTPPPPVDNQLPEPAIKKMERSHSFFLTRKLSKIYNTMTGSKDNLAKIAENEMESSTATVATTPATVAYKFTRSLTMAAIPIRQSFRRVFRESRLEKLHEENDSREQTVVASADVPDSPVMVRRRPKSVAADISATGEERSERRHSFLNQLKRTFSNTPNEKEKSMNPRWSASLASLQQIDMMVSYEDLSFINYDMFNTYEKQLVKRAPYSPQTEEPNVFFPNIAQPVVIEETVRRRQHNPKVKKIVTAMHAGTATDIDANFDQPRNLYRQSLDDKKLKFLNRVTRDSFRWSNNLERTTEDVLMLDNYMQSVTNDITTSSNDVVDGGRTSSVVLCERCVFAKIQRLSQSNGNIKTIAEWPVPVSDWI